MFLSKFDSSIDLNGGRAAIILFCSQHRDITDQHAVIAVELKGEDGYKLYTMDLYPYGPVNNELYGNAFRDHKDKLREGQVRIRVSTLLASTTKKELLRMLHIKDDFLINNYRVGDYELDIAKNIIRLARDQELPNSPKFRYSGMRFDDDEPGLKVFNCITWAKDILSNAGIDLPRSIFSSTLQSSGESSEMCMGLNIPTVHTTDVLPWCNIC